MLLTVNRVAKQNCRPSNGLIISFAYVPIKVRYAKYETRACVFHFTDQIPMNMRRFGGFYYKRWHAIQWRTTQFCFIFFFVFVHYSLCDSIFDCERELFNWNRMCNGCTQFAKQNLTLERRLYFDELFLLPWNAMEILMEAKTCAC